MKKRDFILNLSCPDRVGIVSAVSGALAEMELFILELTQFSDPSTSCFFMRIHFEETREISETEIFENLAKMASNFHMKLQLHNSNYRPRVLIMVSKNSHCLNDLLYRQTTGALSMDIVGIVSNHQDLEEMAMGYKIPFYYLPITSDNSKQQEESLLRLIENSSVDLIILARYMQVISDKMCKMFIGKIINIHHSFLPSFKGARPYHQAFERGVKIIGATAHYVTAMLDEGPIIDQETIHVRHDHTPQQLVQLGRNIECNVLARAVKLHIEQRVILNQHKTVVFS